MGEIVFRRSEIQIEHGTNSLSFGEGWGEVLSPGIYFLSVQTGKQVYRVKVVKY
jgi:hypothetical protein